MWSPQSCLLLVVAASAAPSPAVQAGRGETRQTDQSAGAEAEAESHSTVRRSARVTHYRDIPQTAFTCAHQGWPGIYADQETGCQVFHYCQQGGRVDTFFCPNLTLFNQQYFVCDWEYNVDCSLASQYFDQNQAIFPLHSHHQPNILPALTTQLDLQSAASSEVSRTLNSLVSQLDSRSSALVVDRDQFSPIGQSIGDTSRLSRPGLAVSSALDAGLAVGGSIARLGKSGASYSVVTAPVAEIVTPVPVLALLPINSPLSNSVDSYDDAIADPEPYPGETPDTIAVAAGPNLQSYFVTPPVLAYTPSPPSYSGPPYPQNPLYTEDPQDPPSDPYDDVVADPEPYPGATPSALAAAGIALPYVSVPAPPPSSPAPAAPPPSLAPVAPLPSLSPASARSYALATNTYDYEVADPEPYPGATPAALAAYGLLPPPSYALDPAPSYAPVLVAPSYTPDPPPSYGPDSAPSYGPVPAAPSYTLDPALSYDPVAGPSYPPYTAAYSLLDSADPEPAPLPALSARVYSQYDSPDPEPAAFYGSNTIDLSSDYDDSPAVPEPDPASYSLPRSPGLERYSTGNSIQDYYRALPGQADPEPAPAPEFVPYSLVQ